MQLGTVSLTEQLADCKVGEQKEITLKVTPTKNDEDGFEATVDEVAGYESGDEEEKMPPEKGMMGHGGMKGHAPAVAIVLGGMKAK